MVFSSGNPANMTRQSYHRLSMFCLVRVHRLRNQRYRPVLVHKMQRVAHLVLRFIEARCTVYGNILSHNISEYSPCPKVAVR